MKLIRMHDLHMGCGVTAHSAADGSNLVRERVLGENELPPIAEFIEDVDVSSLDPNHVLPNMLPPVRRGIWFPIGYGESSHRTR
jgi:hypothetical protein